MAGASVAPKRSLPLLLTAALTALLPAAALERKPPSALLGAKLSEGKKAISAYGEHAASKAERDMVEEAQRISIFCFAWTPFGSHDQTMMEEKQLQFDMCDGHAFFTDKDSPRTGQSTNLVKVAVSKQAKARSSKDWLSHRNMAGLIPSWTHALQTANLEKYDWVISSEMDHFMRPSMVRLAIASHLANLRNSTAEEQAHVEAGKPLLLAFGNAFAFNQPMVAEMRRQWPKLQKIQPSSSQVSGCPAWMEGRWRWRIECAQDVVYPIMASDVMQPPVVMLGNPGCGKFSQNALGQQFRLACWEMIQSPAGHGSEKSQLEAMRQIAMMPNTIYQNATDTYHDVTTPEFLSRKRVGLLSIDAGVGLRPQRLAADLDAQWHVFYPGKQVAFVHHVGFASVMKLGRELLGL